MNKLWRSGVILSAAGLLGGLANYAYQGVIGRQLDLTEFGYVNSTMSLIGLLGLPVGIASASLVHYIAHFRGQEDEARLQGLLAGCQKFLFKLTLVAGLLYGSAKCPSCSRIAPGAGRR